MMSYGWLVGLCMMLSSSLVGSAVAQENILKIQFDSDPSPIKMPKDMYLGEVAGVAVNSKGHIFIFSRGGNSNGPAYGNTASQLYEFSANGKFIREIGKNLYAWSYAHAVRIDREDNIWAVDKGSDMIVKFNPAGEVTLVFGRKSEASDTDAHPLEHPNPPLPAVDGRFRQPTDVAFDRDGNAFISDGYINSRVAKVNKDGNWVKQWGSRGSEPGQFNSVHSIASDANGHIYVADRTNRRIQVFDGDGQLLKIIKIDVPFDSNARAAIGNRPDLSNYKETGGLLSPGAPWALCITPPPNQILYAADAYPGRVYKLTLDGKVLGFLGESGKQPKQFGWIHEMACPSENVLFVAELLNWRVQKLVLHPSGVANAHQ